MQYPLMFVAGASHRLPARLTFAATCSLATIASAQWSVINLHPAGASYSEARGVSRGRQVGFAYFGGTHHACLWTGSAQSLIDLNPAGSPEGFAYAVSGERQAGYVDGNDGLYHASVWNATSASWVDLHPKFAGQGSLAYGICLGQQVGVAEYRACLWSNSAASRVDLSPMIGEFFSEALGTSGSQQVGKVYLNSGTRASLWSGSAASWVDLTPVGSIGAEALAVHNGEQVGAVFFEGVSRASLWHGTAASWVDLHPDGAAWSEATGVYGGQQVGHVEIGGVVIASMWSGSADSWENLHTFLPAHFSSSEAFGVWNEAGSTYVAGRGFNTLTGREEALLWRKAAGNGADYDGDGIVDGADNCPESSNADQLDTDGDGMGDACDSCPGAQNMGMDWDYDGIDSACDLDEVMLYAYDERSHVSGSFTLDYVSPSGEERSFDGAADVDFSAMNPVHAVGSGQTGGGLKDEVVVSSTNSMAFEPGRISTVIEGSTQVAEGCTGVQVELLLQAYAFVDCVRPAFYRQSQSGTASLTIIPQPATYKRIMPGRYTFISTSLAQGGGTATFWLVPEDPCPIDLDNDSFVTGIDFDLYVAAFEAGDQSADFDRDGFITGLDFDLYVQAFEAGC